MKTTNKLMLSLAITGVFNCISTVSANSTLGTAQGFSVLSASAVTNTGNTSLSDNLGVSPGTAVTGLGSITMGGTVHKNDALAVQAQKDALSAFTTLGALKFNTNLTGVDLGTQVLTPGVYEFNTSAQLTGELTLNAQNQANATYVFEIGSTLTTASNAIINLINNANGVNIYWLVGSSATIGTGTNFAGTILADQSITLNSGATIEYGRAIALNAAVTMDHNTISSVPLPAALPLMASGIGSFWLLRRRNHKLVQNGADLTLNCLS